MGMRRLIWSMRVYRCVLMCCIFSKLTVKIEFSHVTFPRCAAVIGYFGICFWFLLYFLEYLFFLKRKGE